MNLNHDNGGVSGVGTYYQDDKRGEGGIIKKYIALFCRLLPAYHYQAQLIAKRLLKGLSITLELEEETIFTV